MTDAPLTDPFIASTLDEHVPVPEAVPDWSSIARRAAKRRARRSLILVVAIVLAVTVPALALSGSLRSWLGTPSPTFEEATLLASTPIGDGRSIRVWRAPSSTGGECVFVSYERRDTDRRPSSWNSAACSTAGPLPMTNQPLEVGFSPHVRRTGEARRERTPPFVVGSVTPESGIVRLELRWRHGRIPLVLQGRFFVAVAEILDQPRFDALPIRVVSFDAGGTIVTQRQLSSQGLYVSNQQRAALIAYASAHPARGILVRWNR